VAAQIDRELEEYRTLMEVPDKFEEGFNLKTIVGALFLGFIMLPGSIYLGLVAGQDLGPAAEWVTIILFAEVARRSFTTLKRQEIYLLYYMAGTLVGMHGAIKVGGGPFGYMIYNAYLRVSPAFKGFGIADDIPLWVAPQADSYAITHRTFLHHDWVYAIIIGLIGAVLGRFSWLGLGYTLFRLCADYERLPFPMAPIAAQGATALAETTSREETWRWRVFSIGSMIGLTFGVFYVGIPALSGAVMAKPLQLLPIPWVDLTQNTEALLKATPTGFTCNLGSVLVGFVLPFWAVIGGFISAAGTMFVNPALHHFGMLKSWRPGMDTIQTSFVNSIDFYLSFGIGVSMAIAIIGFYQIAQALRTGKAARQAAAEHHRNIAPKDRGDFSPVLAIAMYVFSSIGYILLCIHLVPKFSWMFVAFFAFVFSPLNSYINARLQGLIGQAQSIPMVKEGVIILSGYKGIDIWFAPLPYFDYGGWAQKFREIELTGTKVTSIIKAEIFMFPLIYATSLLYWWFMWRLAPIPSHAYPYAQKMWHLNALQSGLWFTATMEGRSIFMQAWKPPVAIAGGVFALGSYAILSAFKLPTMLVYGIARGLGYMPHFVVPEIIGALLGRYYFMPRFGTQQWRRYATVLLAGFSCGMGLVGMGCVALAMISKSVTQMPF